MGGRTGAEAALEIGIAGTGTSGGRVWVVRCESGSGARETPGTGGVNLGMSGGRTTGGATGGVTDGATGGVMGRMSCGVTGGVTGRAAGGVARSMSGNTGISPVFRVARATTPGVKTGVGFRLWGGGVNGVANGIERLGGGGSNASGAASASDSITARSFAAQADPGAGTAAEARAGVGTQPPSMPTRITAPHTEHRARTPPGGTFEGSTRNTD